ncbi:RnfH family protein [Spongorhabdus nitratireducens]
MTQKESTGHVASDNSTSEIQVEVAYARPDEQVIVPLTVPAGTTVFEAAQRSGITEKFPEIELGSAKMGIFGKTVPKPQERALENGERVEIYRPLIADPKEVRRRRAEKAKAARG